MFGILGIEPGAYFLDMNPESLSSCSKS